MRNFFELLLIILFLSACTTIEPLTPSPTDTEEPAATSTPTPTPTNTPKPTYTLSGTIFFDYNGSGMRDIAYEMNGEAVEEPGISDVPICLDHDPYEDGIDEEYCTYSNEDGSYTFTDLKNGSHTLYVISPSNEPAEAFRYVNVWKREVTIDDYTKDIDTATMISLETIDSCEENSKALVCKFDEDTLLVREQHLNDTEVKAIEDGIDIRITRDSENDVALMQGFLTLPFIQEQVGEMPLVFNYSDIIGNRFFDEAGNVTFFNSQDGEMLNFNGEYNSPFSPSAYTNWESVKPGVSDSHTGLDFLVNIGNLIVSGAPSSTVWYLANQDGELRVDISFTNPNNNQNVYSTDYGHLAVQLVDRNQIVYRGQIIGVSGNTGTYSGNFPQLHYNIQESQINGWLYFDIYRTTVTFEQIPDSYWGSEYSYWAVDNYPFFGD